MNRHSSLFTEQNVATQLLIVVNSIYDEYRSFKQLTSIHHLSLEHLSLFIRYL